ncbi:lipocalin family protein [Corallibacter sp.]|uniref:lipocalin family protein n=1 Tax=Corallibacter sp. TaxID=2038084 RepID=UPI003AB4C046
MNKIIGLIILFALTINLFNCSKDDDDSQSQPLLKLTMVEKLSAGDGKWYYETGSGANFDACFKTSFFKFMKNNTFQRKFYGIDTNNDCTLQSELANTFEITDDNKIKFNDDSGADVYPIMSFTESELVLQYPTGGELTLDKMPGNYVREPTTEEKLTAGDGKWYLESESNSATDDCKKKSYHQFVTDVALIISSFGPDYQGNCVPVELPTPYRITNQSTIELMDGIGVYRPYSILTLTDDILVLQDVSLNTQTFDKTEG